MIQELIRENIRLMHGPNWGCLWSVVTQYEVIQGGHPRQDLGRKGH